MTTASQGRRWRATLVRHLPASLVVYPFEIVTALVSALMGIALFAGAFRPESLFAILPAPVLAVYAGTALLGALTTAVGVFGRNDFIASLGLRLMAVVLGVYGIAVVAYGGWASAGFAGVFFMAKALTAFLRGLYLRTEADVRAQIRKEGP